MASRSSPVASDNNLQQARPPPVPRQRGQHAPISDDSVADLAHGSADSARTASSVSSYPAARPAAANTMAARLPPGSGRNTSIDSIMSSASANSGAPSSLSNVSHSHNSSTDTTIAHAADPASFIEANGGSVLAVERLLKERQQQTARSEQLWRLLEKQRQMVHGMHADLEKALKDKERYRRRVKDVEEELERAVSALPSAVAAASRHGVNGAYSSHGKTDSVDTLSSMPVIPASPRSPASATHFAKPARAATDSFVSPAAVPPNSARLPASAKADVQFGSPRSAPLRVDSLVSTPVASSAKPVKASLYGSAEKPRKAAPAPLNLAQAAPPKQPVEAEPESDSEYEEDIELPEFERGRKRTRAEDDRQREVLAIAEEMRSRSNKNTSKKTKDKVAEEAAQIALPMSPPPGLPPPRMLSDPNEPLLGSAELAAGMIAGLGLPSSPRAALDGDMQLPLQNNTGSIASVLGASAIHTSPVAVSHTPQTAALPPKSPGLPMSPRPMDRPMNSPAPRVPTQNIAASGPLSPRGLPLSPRAPKYPIPAPSSTPSIAAALTSPKRPVTAPIAAPTAPDIASMAERLQQSQSTIHLPAEEQLDPSSKDPPHPNQIHKGYMSDDYPDLLLAPNALPMVRVKVFSSRLQPPRGGASISSRLSDDDNVFVLGVHARSNSRQLWRVEKSPATLSALDAQLRKTMNLSVSLPERGMFSGHAPAKIDQRRSAINAYFDAIFDSPMSERSALVVCNYFSADVIEPDNEPPPEVVAGAATPLSPRSYLRKEGFLAKKGKQFGGWKSRWFILEDGLLRHYAAPNGEHLGNIRLANAQVATRFRDADEDEEYRHFFAVLEPKRRDSSSITRHVLCAESDDERDHWVNALMAHIATAKLMTSPPSSPKTMQTATTNTTTTTTTTTRSQSFTSGPPPSFGPRKQRTQDSVDSTTTSGLLGVNYEDTVTADAPLMGTPSIVSTVPSPMAEDPAASTASFPHSLISGPRDAQPIPSSSLSAWGHKASSPSRNKDKDSKKRSMFGFITRSSEETGSGSNRLVRGISPRPHHQGERPSTSRPIFGIPLADAAEQASLANANVYLPSPVYRCIQYLEARNAAGEEGIFRLSGSNAVVNGLKERFDSEGDYDMRKGDYIDVHAVASLLKRYLRELPEPILTKELQPKFAKLPEVEDKQKRLIVINYLVHKLPEANREVLVAVFSYLIKVVNGSDKNRMNVKNVGIVFAPTLNIPMPLVSLFIVEHDTCFTPSPLDPITASQIVDQLSDVALPNGIDELAASKRQILATYNVSTPHSAGLGSMSGSPDPQMLAHDPYARFNGSFGEATAGRSLSETRRELRKANGNGDLRDAISKPVNPMPAGAAAISTAINSRSRSRGSPSPGSASYMTPPHMRSTPPPKDDSSNGSGLGFNPMTHSSAGSSPSSYMGGVPRGWDSPSTDSGVPTSRKAKRESTMQGISGPLSSLSKSSTSFDSSAEPRKKSSYTRLKENVGGMGSLREA